jgi:hypothetical protein
MRTTHVWWVLLLALVDARRIALTENEVPTPLLYTGGGIMAIQWSSAEMVRSIHLSQAIEVGARGIRFVSARWTPLASFYKPSSSSTTTFVDTCNSSALAFCDTGMGLVLPSLADNVIVTGLPSAGLSNRIAQGFSQQASKACDERGDGRVMLLNASMYTASACDIMQGHLVLILRPADDEAMLFPQTFGPMAYTVILITCLICIYGASSLEQTSWQKYVTWGVCAAGTTACCLLYALSGIAFVTAEDQAHFWMSVVGTILVVGADAIATFYFSKEKMLMQHVKGIDLCIYMLGSIADALYRSPETPYATIFVTALAIRAWQKIYTLFFDVTTCQNIGVLWILHLKLLYNLMYLSLTAECGLVSQYTEREVSLCFALFRAAYNNILTLGGRIGPSTRVSGCLLPFWRHGAQEEGRDICVWRWNGNIRSARASGKI